MSEMIYVDPNAMYSLENEINSFNHSLSFTEKEIEHLVGELNFSFRECSRYEDVKACFHQASKDLSECSSYLHSVAQDISRRAAFLIELEKKPLL